MPGVRWSQQEKNALEKQLRSGTSLQKIRVKGRSFYSIRSQALRMGLVDRGPSKKKWTRELQDRLRELKENQFTPSQIYRYNLLGDPSRSIWSITKQWGRMKLSDRKRSEQMKRKKRWEPGERKRFDAFLRAHSTEMTPEEIGKAWNVARSTVARRQTELGVKASREEVMRMAYSQAKQERARERIRRGNLKNWRQRRRDRETRLVELADTLRKSSTPPEEQECTDCQRSFPKRKDFFHATEKKISIGRSRYFKHRCVLCENARRRKKARRRAPS